MTFEEMLIHLKNGEKVNKRGNIGGDYIKLDKIQEEDGSTFHYVYSIFEDWPESDKTYYFEGDDLFDDSWYVI